MRRDDYILALTSGLLTADEAHFEKAVTHFSQFYELRQPGRPGYVSIAGTNQQNIPTDFIQWIGKFRDETIKQVVFRWSESQPNASLPAHIQAAFAGPQFLEMQITAGETNAATTWRLQTLMSAQYEMTAAQFTSFIDTQHHTTTLWRRIEEIVNESNRLNNRPVIEAGQIKKYLQGQGMEVYNYIVSQLVTEIQVELQVLDSELLIPPAFENLLYRSELDSFFGPSDDRIPVFLYPTGPVTITELLDLVQAQRFDQQEIWTELERSLAEYPLVNIPATGYPEALKDLDDASVNELGHSVCRAIAERCEKNSTQPIIPKDLLHCIGPDELDGKRAQARSRLSGGKQFYLQSNQQPWELYLFAKTNATQPSENEPREYIRSHFISTLKQIAALADKMQTPFTEAFSTANFLLTGDLPSGNFDETHENKIAETLQQNGFSEQAVNIFKGNFAYIKDLHLLGWPPERLFGLCATSMADVFGGMGSWNDLDPGDDGLEYQRLSADLFETLKGYLAILLSQ